MKISLKLQDDNNISQNHDHHHRHHVSSSPIVTAKIPISIFNHPFLTSISSTISDSSNLSLSLSSNFASGPSLKLSYSPTATPTLSPPFSLSLKSGLGLFGSPNHSPLIFTAHFSFSSPNPTFSLLFTPQFGNFSFKKTTSSNPRVFDSGSGPGPGTGANSGSGSTSNFETGNGFVPEGSSVWQELKLEPCGGKSGGFKEGFGVCTNGSEKDGGILSGIAVMASTVFPVTKRVKMNVRWGVNLPSDLGYKMPYLKLNKIGIERVEKDKEEKKKKKSDETSSELEMLKGMCFWMSRDLEVLERANREMKESLEQMKVGVSAAGGKHFRLDSASKMPLGKSSSEFERWRNRKNVKEENGKREPKKPANQAANDLESELERAIKAAAGAAST